MQGNEGRHVKRRLSPKVGVMVDAVVLLATWLVSMERIDAECNRKRFHALDIRPEFVRNIVAVGMNREETTVSECAWIPERIHLYNP